MTILFLSASGLRGWSNLLGALVSPEPSLTSNGSHQDCLFLKTPGSDSEESTCPVSFPAATGFPVATSIPRLLDAIGLFRMRNKKRQVRRCRFRFCHTSSPFCSCILFAIVLEQLIKLEFLAQQVELKWLTLNKWSRLFHSSRVKLPSVKMSASWYVWYQMYRIWILESRLILSNNQPKATLWFLTHVSLWDFGLW